MLIKLSGRLVTIILHTAGNDHTYCITYPKSPISDSLHLQIERLLDVAESLGLIGFIDSTIEDIYDYITVCPNCIPRPITSRTKALATYIT